MKVVVTYSNEIVIGHAKHRGFVVLIHEGEWDTYREMYLFSRTKPTARQLRKAVKEFNQL